MRLITKNNIWNDPFADLDYFLNKAFESPIGSLLKQDEDVSARGFPMDTFSDDDNYYAVAELPGFERKQIALELENSVLTIKAKGRDSEKGQTNVSSRSITIGDDVSQEKVNAKLENGLLTVTLPKAEARKPRSITIK